MGNIAKYSTPQFPPWALKAPEYQFSLSLLGSKSEVSPTLYETKLNELLSVYDGFTKIFTDGSKIGEAAGAAAVLAPRVSNKRLPNHSSIFTAETRAILLALELAQRSSSNQFLILCDSLSCLQSMRNRGMSRPLIAEVLCCIHKMLLTGATLVFLWVPSHVGLAGNSAADTAAKAAVLMPISSLTLPYSDYLPLIRTHVLNQWQSSWSLETENKLHAIEPTVNETKSYRLPRRDEIIIHRLRIGHTFLTHGYLLKRDSPPQCSACQTQLTVEHVLLHCQTWNAIRANYFTVTNLSELFNTVSSRSIVDFIKEIGFYRRI